MPSYTTGDIRNIALVGHGVTGKTTLADLFLFKTGMNTRAGSVDEGSSLFDCDDEERDRKSSITSAIGHFSHQGKRVNVIDTPGYPDFIGQVVGALDAVETAIVVINASSGVEVNTRRVFGMAGAAGVGRAIVINKLDNENIDFAGLVMQIQEVFGQACVPVNIPDQVGSGFSAVIPVLGGSGGVVDVSEYEQALTDSIVEADEELMERYLETMELSAEEAAAGMSKAIAAGTLVPIFCVSSRKDVGVAELLDDIAAMLPSPVDVARLADDGTEIKPDPEGPLIAQVFKTRIDPFVAKMNFVRVFSGKLRKDASVRNLNTEKDFKVAGLNEAQGHTLNAVTEAIPGDIVALVKIDGLHVSDSLGTLTLPAIDFPRPMVGLAVEPKTTADQQKISGAFAKVVEEDQTIQITREAQTHEMVVHGMSDLHLQIVLERIAKRDKVGVNSHMPKIPYRETIADSAQGHYRHKKQSGGSGQFAEVHLKIEALPRGIDPAEYFTKERFESLREVHYDPELNFAFVDRVSGGSVPNQYIPAVEKGVKERMTRGVIAGYQIQDCACALFFGKDHPVDSNESAFKMAGSVCFRNLFQEAKPALLEPIVKIEITVPSDKVGDITADLTTRRGRLEGMDQAPGGLTVLLGHVPLAEVQDYARTLSSMTGGQGSYTFEPSHYEMVPGNEQQKIVAAAKLEDEEH